MSAHNIVPIDHSHTGLIFAAALEGLDVSPCVGGQRFIGYGDTKYGYGPACILDVAGTEYVAEPHVVWFPWTSKANRIVNFKWAMKYLAQTRQVFIIVEKGENAFHEHFVKKGILRKVGYLKDIPIVDEVHMYQYERDSQ